MTKYELVINLKTAKAGRLHWQVRRFFAFQDAVHVAGSAPELIGLVGPVGDQAALIDRRGPGGKPGRRTRGQAFG